MFKMHLVGISRLFDTLVLSSSVCMALFLLNLKLFCNFRAFN